MSSCETYFPRGPVKKGSSNHKTNDKKIKKDKPLVLFKKKPSKKRHEPRKQRKEKKEHKRTPVRLNNVSLLLYETLEKGFLVAGCIKEIYSTQMTVTLPGRLVAQVKINKVSNPFNSLLSSYTDGDVLPEDVPTLNDLFKIGELVTCCVEEVFTTDRGKHKVLLSLNPADINRDKTEKILEENVVIVGAIKTKEDHGYAVDLGIEGVTAFLPFKRVASCLQSQNCETLPIGKIIRAAVKKVVRANIGTTTVELTLEPDNVSKAVPRSGFTIDNLTPGQQMNIFIKQIIPNGIEVSPVHAFENYDSYVHIAYVSDIWGNKSGLLPGKVFSATFLYSLSPVNILYFSLKNYTSESNSLPYFQDGTIVDDAKVIATAKNGIYLQLGSRDLNAKGFVSSKQLSNETNFSIGQSYKTRILHYDFLEKVYICSLNKDIISAEIFSTKELHLGQTVKCIVMKFIEGRGLTLKIGTLNAFAPIYHLTDFPHRNVSTVCGQYKINKVVKAKVLQITEGNEVLLTLKPTLLSSESLCKLEDAVPRKYYYGTISKIIDSGIIVRFFGDVYGFVPDRMIASHVTGLSKESYHVGQVIRCYVVFINPQEKRLIMSMIPCATNGELEKSNNSVVNESNENGMVFIDESSDMNRNGKKNKQSNENKNQINSELLESSIKGNEASRKGIKKKRKNSECNGSDETEVINKKRSKETSVDESTLHVENITKSVTEHNKENSKLLKKHKRNSNDNSLSNISIDNINENIEVENFGRLDSNTEDVKKKKKAKKLSISDNGVVKSDSSPGLVNRFTVSFVADKVSIKKTDSKSSDEEKNRNKNNCISLQEKEENVVENPQNVSPLTLKRKKKNDSISLNGSTTDIEKDVDDCVTNFSSVQEEINSTDDKPRQTISSDEKRNRKKKNCISVQENDVENPQNFSPLKLKKKKKNDSISLNVSTTDIENDGCKSVGKRKSKKLRVSDVDDGDVTNVKSVREEERNSTDDKPRLSSDLYQFSWNVSAEDFTFGLKEKSSNDYEDDSDNNDDNDDIDKHNKPRTAAEKKAAAKEAEKRLRLAEQNLLEAESNPQSVDHFERLVLAQPNNSLIWVKYMAYHLQATEIEKARAVGNRALKVISHREEQERLNVWVALLNLENLYGTQESLKNTLDEAVRSNDEYKVYSKMAEIYADSKKNMELDQLTSIMVKKFKTDLECWLLCCRCLLKSGFTEKAHSIFQRGLQNLLKKEHVPYITRFALMENTMGSPEHAQTLMENVLATYPSKISSWITYVNMLTKSGQIELARNVLERSVSQKLPVKKMKTLYKKWLQFEEQYGSEASVNHVQEAARNYVNSLNAAITSV